MFDATPSPFAEASITDYLSACPTLAATYLREANHGFLFEWEDGQPLCLNGHEAMGAPWWPLLPKGDREHVEFCHKQFMRKGWDVTMRPVVGRPE